jgi:hypothetical protein
MYEAKQKSRFPCIIKIKAIRRPELSSKSVSVPCNLISPMKARKDAFPPLTSQALYLLQYVYAGMGKLHNLKSSWMRYLDCSLEHSLVQSSVDFIIFLTGCEHSRRMQAGLLSSRKFRKISTKKTERVL